jgi:2-polyprenyl-3-methyl-5-hydroxy-6-metoxy-1,4-benzoquinol methylase
MDNALENPTITHVPDPTVSPLTEQRDPECIICQARLNAKVVDAFDTRFGIDGKYAVWRCSQCQLEQIYPVPLSADLKNLYESHYNFGGEKDTPYTRLREWFFSSFLYRAWIRIDGDLSFHARKGTGRLIDIGCNEGRGLEIYARNGFQVEGLELNDVAASQARNRGFIVHVLLIEDFRPAVPYDVAVLSNVLEHSVDPRQMLLDVRRILARSGQIWISCPNNQSWLRGVFGEYWINWHLPFHISHFSPETITNLLKQTGFTAIEIRQVTPAAWLASSVIARMFAKRGRLTRELRNPILLLFLMLLVRVFLFPFLWMKKRFGKGDCLLITAAKSLP